MPSSAPSVCLVGTGPMALAFLKLMEQVKVKAKLYTPDPARSAKLSDHLNISAFHTDLEQALEGTNNVFFAVSALELAEVVERYAPLAQPNHRVFLACRGTGPDFALPHEILRRKTAVRKIGVIGGPVDQSQIQENQPIQIVLASRFEEIHRLSREVTQGLPVQLATTQDLIGVQVAGAIANATAIAVGAADHFKMGEAIRVVLLVHGLADARRLGVALGADAETFSGLAGLGELIPRRVPSVRRHLRLGARLAEGATTDEALAGLSGHVEGVVTVRAAAAKAKALGLKLPLIDCLMRLMHEKEGAKAHLEALLRAPIQL